MATGTRSPTALPPGAPHTLRNNLAQAVSATRGEENWSRQELAKRSGLSERFIADVERGLANPSLETLEALAEALHLSVPTMLSGEVNLLPKLGAMLMGLTPDKQEEIAAWLATKLDGRHPARRVALLGVRGAGKTTVGRLLAAQLSCPFVELDRLVEESAGHKLAQIFELHGDAYYRRIEREVLARVLTEHHDVVIATGGGLVTNEETFSLLRSGCRTVWLKTRPEEYLARVQKQGDSRPFQSHPQALLEVKALLAAREPAYRRADLVVDTTLHAPEACAQRLATWIERAAARMSG